MLQISVQHPVSGDYQILELASDITSYLTLGGWQIATLGESNAHQIEQIDIPKAQNNARILGYLDIEDTLSYELSLIHI